MDFLLCFDFIIFQYYQISYIESIIRGVAGSATKITINSPFYGGSVDGKQELGEEMINSKNENQPT